MNQSGLGPEKIESKAKGNIPGDFEKCSRFKGRSNFFPLPLKKEKDELILVPK